MRFKRLMILGAVVAVLAVSGCAKEADTPVLEPSVAPPVIGEAGVLRAGVDLDYPPFAGKDGGEEAGLDVDIAAALAERLGLTLELVDIGSDGAAEALESGDIDIALGALPITDAVLADVAFAGSYLVDGPAFFTVAASSSVDTTASTEASESADASVSVPTMDMATISGLRVGAQEGSVAYWMLESEYGEGFATAYDTLTDAFDALVAGDIDAVACDAAVGAYIGRDYTDVAFAGQYGSGVPVGVAIAKDATELETVVRETLDAIVAEGVLDTIRSKWLDALPILDAASAE